MAIPKKDPETGTFMLRQFLEDRHVASIKSTSPYLVRRICSRLIRSGPRVVVEFGPGLGCFTQVLLKCLRPDAILILIESNGDFVARLSRLGDPRLRIVWGSAEDVRGILARVGFSRADAVLSGIPFSHFRENARQRLLAEIRGLLGESGLFIAYQSTARLQKDLRRLYPRVRVEHELFHIPPLVVLEARVA